MNKGFLRFLVGVSVWTAALCCISVLFLPLAVLVVFSFNSFPYGVFPLEEPTLKWYAKLLGNRNIVEAVLNSCYISSLATLVALVLGTLGAYATDRVFAESGRWYQSFVYAPMIAPGIIVGISLAFFFSLLQLPLGRWSVVIGHVTFLAPFVFVIMSAAFRRFDRTLQLAGRNLGATEAQAFLRITLPILKPSLIGSALFCWTLSFEEFIVTFFTIGTESNLSMEVFSKLRIGVTPELNALGTLQIGVAVVFGLWVSSRLEKLFH